MRKILLIAMMCVCLGMSAQNSEGYEVYGIVRMEYLTSENYFFLLPNKINPQKILDENGQQMFFNNITHLLLYLSQRGWRYIDEYDEQDKTTTLKFYRIFILGKKVKTVEEITDGLKLEEVPSKRKERDL